MTTCGINPVGYANNFMVTITKHGISCNIQPTVDNNGRIQSVILPEIKADPVIVGYGDVKGYMPADRLEFSKVMFDVVFEQDGKNYNAFYNWMRVGLLDQEKGFADVIINIMNPLTFQPSVSYVLEECLVVNLSSVNFDITNTDVARFTVVLQPRNMSVSN